MGRFAQSKNQQHFVVKRKVRRIAQSSSDSEKDEEEALSAVDTDIALSESIGDSNSDRKSEAVDLDIFGNHSNLKLDVADESPNVGPVRKRVRVRSRASFDSIVFGNKQTSKSMSVITVDKSDDDNDDDDDDGNSAQRKRMHDDERITPFSFVLPPQSSIAKKRCIGAVVPKKQLLGAEPLSSSSMTRRQQKAREAVSTDPNVHKGNVTDLQRVIRDAAQRVFDMLGAGLSESIYRDALAVELQHRRVRVWSDREVVLPLHHRNRYVGFCRSDIVLLCSSAMLKTDVVGGSDSDSEIAGEQGVRCDGDGGRPRTSRRAHESPPVVIELKANSSPLNSCNVQQLLAYMRLLKAAQGVLINFVQGDSDMQRSISNLVLIPRDDIGLCFQTRQRWRKIQHIFVNFVDSLTKIDGESDDSVEEIADSSCRSK